MRNFDTNTFIEEALELLEVVEHELINLEKDPDDTEIINTIFRALHTIKGSGGMFGFKRITGFAHILESLFTNIRKGKLAVNKKIIDLTLASCDLLRSLLSNPDNNTDHYDEENDLVRQIQETDSNITRLESQPAVGNEAVEEPQKKLHKIYRIKFDPGKELFLRGVKPEALLKEIGTLGNAHFYGSFKDLPDLDAINPEECYTQWTIILSTNVDENRIRDVFIFVEDYCTIEIEMIDDELENDDIDYKRIGEILINRKDISREQLDGLIAEKQLLGKMAVEKGLISEDVLASALDEQKIVREERGKRRKVFESATIRVNHDKLDELINLVGELVTLQARLNQYVSTDKNTELQTISESLGRLTSSLRDNTMNLRMVPLTNTFNSFNRLIRDVSKELDKDVEFSVSGADTELDKNVIEALKDPIMHILRNSIGHGIETKEERHASGKPLTATVTISAEYSGANVLIRIMDDGRGLDLERIKRTAVDKGLILANAQLSDSEVMNLIFMPGFSTSEQTTDLSGRGVGLDVVKRNIEKLRGMVTIDSKPGKGTTFTLQIPLTLAIIDGLLMEIANNYYIMNLAAVDECIDFTPDVIHQSKNKELIKFRDELVPYINLRKQFNIEEDKPEIEQLVIAQVNNTRIGFKVDNVIGQHQTVIKSISRVYKDVEEVSGATILGDGSIALILDVNKLSERVEKESIYNTVHTDLHNQV